MTDELKACPFCGAKALIVDDDGFRYLVACRNWRTCQARSPSTRYYNFKEHAIAAWNTRHEPDTLPQWAIEAIEQGIEYAIVNANANQNYPVKHARYFALCESLEWVLSLRKPEEK